MNKNRHPNFMVVDKSKYLIFISNEPLTESTYIFRGSFKIRDRHDERIILVKFFFVKPN